MAKSTAAGTPLRLGRKISAGRRCWFVISSGLCGSSNPAHSFSGTRCREQQCGEVFSNRLPYMCSHSEKVCQGCHYTEGTTGIPSRWRSSATKRAMFIRVCPPGLAARNARAPGSASDRSRACAIVAEAPNCICHDASSTKCVRLFCFMLRTAPGARGCRPNALKKVVACMTAGSKTTAAAMQNESNSSQARAVVPLEARKAAGLSNVALRRPSPAWQSPRLACSHWAKFKYKPVMLENAA